MSLWNTNPVNAEPVLTLCSWSVFQTEKGERHFVGYNDRGREGRVSSAITSFDKKTMTGRTSSGRLYALAGPSGYDSDAEYVKHRWIDINNVTEMVDVTKEYE